MKEEDQPIEYKLDEETGRVVNRNGYTVEESKQIAFNAQKSRELDPERGVWSQKNITSEQLIKRANAARVFDATQNGNSILTHFPEPEVWKGD